jgi:hypothetical protein
MATSWTPRLQVRTGTLCTIGGVILALYGPFTSEQFLIYEMSAFALVLAGLGVLVTAVLAVKEDPDTSEDDLDPDT